MRRAWRWLGRGLLWYFGVFGVLFTPFYFYRGEVPVGLLSLGVGLTCLWWLRSLA